MSDRFLLSLFGGSTNSTSTLLATLYGQPGSRASSVSPFQALRSAEQNKNRDIDRTASQPEVKRAIDGFRAGIAKATTVDALLRDPRVMEVLLTANGLGDQTGRAALARRTFQSDLSDPTSLVNRLSDSRWRPAVETFDFAKRGLDVIHDPQVIERLADAYAEVKWRRSLDTTTPGLSNALTFRAQASTVTSALQILGDPVLRDVVTLALGLPKQIAFQPVATQERAITTRLDIKKLGDPKFVESFVQRYLLAAAENAQAAPATDLITLAVRVSGLVV